MHNHHRSAWMKQIVILISKFYQSQHVCKVSYMCLHTFISCVERIYGCFNVIRCATRKNSLFYIILFVYEIQISLRFLATDCFLKIAVWNPIDIATYIDQPISYVLDLCLAGVFPGKLSIRRQFPCRRSRARHRSRSHLNFYSLASLCTFQLAHLYPAIAASLGHLQKNGKMHLKREKFVVQHIIWWIVERGSMVASVIAMCHSRNLCFTGTITVI